MWGFSVCVRTPLALCSGGLVLSFCRRRRWFCSDCPHGVQPGDVVGQSGQGEFVSYLVQSTGTKLAHSTLLFEDSKNRFDEGLAAGVGGLSGRASQLGAHAAMRRVAGPGAAARAQVQGPRHVRVRYISIDVALLHLVEVVDRKKSAVGQSRARRCAAALLSLV